MGRISTKGEFKQVYYTTANLSAEELDRYFQFNTPLSENNLKIVKEWCSTNLNSFAIVDEDYIFFTANLARKPLGL